MQSQRTNKLNDFWVAAWAIVGLALGILMAQWIYLVKRRPVFHVDALNIEILRPEKDTVTQPNSQPRETGRDNHKMNFEESAQRRMPEIYLGVATIIQGITVGVLGETIVELGLNQSLDWMVWAMGIASLLVALIYWIAFVKGYLYLYRIVRLQPVDHIVVTLAYFVMGLCQIIAYQLVNRPTWWLASISVLALVASGYSVFLVRMIQKQSSSIKPLGNQIEEQHRRLSRLYGVAAIILALSIWVISRWPPPVLLIPIVCAIILGDQIRNFKKRTRAALLSPVGNTE